MFLQNPKFFAKILIIENLKLLNGCQLNHKGENEASKNPAHSCQKYLSYQALKSNQYRNKAKRVEVRLKGFVEYAFAGLPLLLRRWFEKGGFHLKQVLQEEGHRLSELRHKSHASNQRNVVHLPGHGRQALDDL